MALKTAGFFQYEIHFFSVYLQKNVFIDYCTLDYERKSFMLLKSSAQTQNIIIKSNYFQQF